MLSHFSLNIEKLCEQYDIFCILGPPVAKNTFVQSKDKNTFWHSLAYAFQAKNVQACFIQ